MKRIPHNVLLPLYYIIILVIITSVFKFGFKPEKTVLNEIPDKALMEERGLYIISNKLYYQESCSYEVPDVAIPLDVKSLHFYNKYYFGDKESVWAQWIHGCEPPTKLRLSPSLDVPSFKVFSERPELAKDRYGAISFDKRMPSDLTGDFEYMHDDFLSFHGRAYYYNFSSQTVFPVPYVTFPFSVKDASDLRYVITADKVFAFYPWKVGKSLINEMKGVDPKSFHHITDRYWADTEHVYMAETIVPKALPSDFSSIGGGYFSSNGGIYVDATRIADTNTSNFVMVPGQPTKEDFCDSPYWTDQRNVFYNGSILDVNVSTFTFDIRDGFRCKLIGYSGDGASFFYAGDKIEGADARTFKIINHDFARDAFHVYDQGQSIVGDPEQLEKEILSGKLVHLYPECDEGCDP